MVEVVPFEQEAPGSSPGRVRGRCGPGYRRRRRRVCSLRTGAALPLAGLGRAAHQEGKARMHQMGPVARWPLLCGLLALIAGCASTSVRPVSTYSGATLPKPGRVLVIDFAVSPDQVSINRGLFASGAQESDGPAPNAEELKLGQEVATALSEELVKRIAALGLTTQRAPAGTKAERGTMVIQGRFVSIDEGSRVKRMVIGFGAGSTVVKTFTEVYVGSPNGPVLAQRFETEAKSAPTPGLVMGGPAVAAGKAAAAGVHAAVKVATETRKGVAADAARTAEGLAKQLGEFFVAQGWISRDALK